MTPKKASSVAAAGKYEKAVKKFPKSGEIKLDAYVEDHIVCISLSGLADAYLLWSDVDPSKLPLARETAERMLRATERGNVICPNFEGRAGVMKLNDDGTDRILKRCSRCQQVWFCDAECRAATWPMHKKTGRARYFEETDSESLTAT
jgi:hypothetical protein